MDVTTFRPPAGFLEPEVPAFGAAKYLGAACPDELAIAVVVPVGAYKLVVPG